MAQKQNNILQLLNPKNWFNTPEKKILSLGSGSWERRNLITHVFDGEKNLGEAGPIKLYGIDYTRLRWRSWQAFLESDLSQIIINRYLTWVVGKGLKLQSEPPKKIFELEKITVDTEEFSKQVEAYFDMFSINKKVDYASMTPLSKIAKTAFKNALIGGDVLVILRYENKNITIQLIDAEHIKSPMGGNGVEYTLANGNKMYNGVEKDSTGKHVSYHVCLDDYSLKEIPARIEGTDLQCAFLVTALEYRIGETRGMPILGVILEKIKKLDRYSDAALGSAEERAKIIMFLEHELNATGDTPFTNIAAKAMDATANKVPQTDDGKILADNIAVTTNKQTFNLNPGSTIKQVDSKNDLYFKDFFTTHIHLVSASIGMPHNVAMAKYDDNYSSSRAAIKDWENTLNVGRDDFSNQFYKPVYEFWLQVMILLGKIKAPGYIEAMGTQNDYILTAYRKARFIGTPVPHIDPVKEVEAIRNKLGPLGAHLPLTTLEAATEDLNGGEALANIEQFATEFDFAKEHKLEPVPVAPVVTTPPKKD